MMMIPFSAKFADLAWQETRTITVRGRDELPDGEYGFVESYCDEVSCDCRRVMLTVLGRTSGSRVWATISYGWESGEFYERWVGRAEEGADTKGPYLDPFNPQSRYANVLLGMFEYVLTDRAYVERLARHYRMFKVAAKNEQERSGLRQKRKRQKLRTVK
ncbi:MAG: hypothetical protein H0W76_16135 [Pyrinomonadaceae bacterium]|nr:hypothetical protein [Pyrinomonadaceae bacterium]